MKTGSLLQKLWTLPLMLLLTAVIGIGQVQAQGNTFFVDVVAGDNTFNGSQMAVGAFPNGPFKTITQAITTATDGDTIVILAGDYTAENVLVVAENLMLQVRTSGGNVNVVVDGFTVATAGKTLTLADEAGGGAGVFLTNSNGNELTLTDGSVNVTGGLTFASGATVTRTNGVLTGNAPTVSNLNVTYTGALASDIMARNELPASIGTGKLTISHTGSLLTVPNSTTVNDLQATTAGHVTFSQNLTTTGGTPTDVNIDGAGTFTVSGTATIAGGIDVDAAASLNWGATSIAGAVLDNNGGTLTFASLNATGQNVVNVAGTLTVTGDLRLGVTPTATRVTVTAGTMTVGSLTADPLVDTQSDEADVIYTIDNDATFVVNGAITEGVLNVTGGANGEAASDTVEYAAFAIENAADQKFTIGASSTIRGNINNAERDAGMDGQGIILANGAVLTVQADDVSAAANLTSIGDVVGGTLILNYANANENAGDAASNQSVTLVNNLTFGSNVATLAAPANDANNSLTVGGDLRLGAGVMFPYNFTVTGTVFIDADNVVINGYAAGPVSPGGAQSFGGFNAGSNTATIGVAAEAPENVTITGSTAAFNDSDVVGAVTATTGPAAVTASAGASFLGLSGGSITLSGTGQVDNDGPLNSTGNVTIPNGLTLDQTALGVASDIDGNLVVNGTFAIAGGGTLNVDGNVDIDATTGALTTAGATTFAFGGNFTGGTYTDTGQDDDVTFNAASGGSTVSVKPGTAVNSLTFNGSGRTVTVTESISVDSGVTLGNDVTVALGANSFIIAGGDLTLSDEAEVTNQGTDGSIQFTGTGLQNIVVTGVPNTNPTLQNIVVNITGNNDLDIDNAINVAGTITVLDGEITKASNITFTGSAGKLAYKADTADGVTSGPLGGVHDLEYLGGPANGGGEYQASNIRNLTIGTTGALTAPMTAATISGNLTVNSTGEFISQANLTVQGNATMNGDMKPGNGTTVSIAGALSVASTKLLGNTTAGQTATVQLTGANQTHSVKGQIGDITTTATTLLHFTSTATGVTVNGSTANVPEEAEFEDIQVDAGASVTMNNVQGIQDNNAAALASATVTVSGSLVLNMTENVANTEGKIVANITVNNGGSLSVSHAGTGEVFERDDVPTANTIAINDGGTFTLGSNLAADDKYAVNVGNNVAAALATFDLNGNTFTLGANTFTVTSNTGGTAPAFGSSGTLNIGADGSISGGTNPTIPNLTINGGVAAEIDSDVTVTGTFTVTATSNGADGDNVTLSGASATGQFNANFTGTPGPTGSQVITTGTSIASTAAAVTITNLNVNSTSTTELVNNDPAAGQQTTVFTVAFLNHDQGVLEFNNNTLTLVGDDTGSTVDWDYDGGSYSNANGLMIINDNGDDNDIDLDTNDQTITLANLSVLNNNAAAGLSINASDGVVVTGTLTLGTNANASVNIIKTEAGATDGSFTVADGATIVRNTHGAGNPFDNAPTLRKGLTVRYTDNSANVTTANELPATLTRLEYEATTLGRTLILKDGVALTVDQLKTSAIIDIDNNDDGDNSITITDGGRIEYNGAQAEFTSFGVDEVPNFDGAATLQFDGGFGATVTSDTIWPDALVPTVVVNSVGANVDVQLHEGRTAAAVTVGDGSTTNTSQITVAGGTTLTVNGASTIAADGTIKGGTLDVNGTLSNSGVLTSNVTASQSITLTGNLGGTLTLDGSAAQTVTVPAAGVAVNTLVVANTSGGVTVAGGNIAVGTQTVSMSGISTATGGGLTLTSGVLNMGGNTLLLAHAGSGQQGFTPGNGCVFGNVRKQLSNTTNTAPADRLEFPLCTSSGISRPYALTFNNPGIIGGVAPSSGAPAVTAAPAITVRHDQAGENDVVDLTGTNGLPQTVNGITVARYPTGSSFFWTVTPSFTMSPSLSYDVDMRANNYPNFTTSCDTEACDINEIFPIRRHSGSTSNLWTVASSTIDNFLAGDDDPVVVGRGATGALQQSGTVFTFGLKSIFADAPGTPEFVTTTGNAHVVDLSTLFTGFTGALTYKAVTSDAPGVANPGTGDVAGNNLTVTGGSDTGAATVTVTAQNSFLSTASATFTVTNSAALASTSDNLDRTLNVGGTSTVAHADVFTGGAGTLAFSASSDNAAVTVADDGTTVTLTAASDGSAVITMTATDQSTTPVVVSKTFTVTVNNAVSAAAIANQSVTQGQTVSVDVSSTFSGGTGTVAVSVSGSTDVASAEVVGTEVVVTGLKAYEGSPLTDTAPVTFTVTGTDDLGDAAQATFAATVTPVAGDLSGTGGPTAFGASLALQHFLGLVTLTPNQIAAADFDQSGSVTPFDAFQIWQASQPPKSGQIEQFANARLVFGEVARDETGLVYVPVRIDGDAAEAGALQFSTLVDPAYATVKEVRSELGSEWMFNHTVSDDGDVRLAAIGLGGLEVGSDVAVLVLELASSDAEFALRADAAVNANPVAAIDEINVVELPETFALQGNYPNPFRGSTTITVDLPEAAKVSVEVVDMLGRLVMNVPAQDMAAGAQRRIQIDGSTIASGSYFYRVTAEMDSATRVETGRMMLVK